MSAEGTPREAGSSPALERVLVQITRFVLRFPISTLILGVVLACAALGYSQFRLGFRTSRSDLLNPKSEFNQLWLDYVTEFGDEQDVVRHGLDRGRLGVDAVHQRTVEESLDKCRVVVEAARKVRAEIAKPAVA